MKTDAQRVLVTGGSGYIGSRLCEHFAQLGFDVHRLTRREPELKREGITDFVGDISDPDVWEPLCEADVIVHLAAQTSTYVANNDPVADRIVNVDSFLGLLETCRRRARKPFVVLASTVTVVGVTNFTAVTEECPTKPVTVYDAHKLMAEQYLETYCRLGHARGTTLRLANVYGPSQAGGSPDRGILNRMVNRALAGSPLTVYGTGESLRDYVYIDDVVEAFVVAMRHQSETNGRHWIVASGESHSIRGAFEIIRDQVASSTGRRVEIETVEPQYELSPIESRNFVADISGFKSATGWHPTVKLTDGIGKTIEALLGKTVGAF